MKILHIHDILMIGGIPAAMLRIAREMQLHGVESEFYIRKHVNAGVIEEYRSSFPVFCAPHPLLRQGIVNGRYNLLRATVWAQYFTFPAVASAGFKGPVVVSTHQAVPTDPIPPRADHILSVAYAGARAVTNPHKIPIHVIHNGINTSEYSPPSSEEPELDNLARSPSGKRPILLWVGRIRDWMKGFPLFLSVVSAMNSEDFDYWAIYSDEYPCAPDLERSFAGKLTMTHSVSMQQMPFIFRKTTQSHGCLLMTSHTECCPNAAIEAMACGCPVVAARVGGVPEIVVDGDTGALFESGAIISEIVRKVRQVCSHESWNKLSVMARKRAVEDFDEKLAAKRYAEFFREVVSNSENRHQLTVRQHCVRWSLPFQKVIRRLGIHSGRFV